MRRAVGGSVAIWAVLAGSLWASGWDPDIPVLGGILVAGGVVLFVAIDLAVRVRAVVWPVRAQTSEPASQDHERVKVLVDDLNRSQRTDPHHLRDTLVGIVDDRLFIGHGIERATQPDAAGEILTPHLQRLVGGRAPHLDDVNELQSVLTELEKL